MKATTKDNLKMLTVFGLFLLAGSFETILTYFGV